MKVHKALPGSSFNSLLLNRYKGGNEYVGWHSDDEKLYGSTPEIATVSFGCDRDFLLKKKKLKNSSQGMMFLHLYYVHGVLDCNFTEASQFVLFIEHRLYGSTGLQLFIGMLIFRFVLFFLCILNCIQCRGIKSHIHTVCQFSNGVLL